MKFTSFSQILERKAYLAKINNSLNRHGAGPPEARGPMHPHRLHRLKAGLIISTVKFINEIV